MYHAHLAKHVVGRIKNSGFSLSEQWYIQQMVVGRPRNEELPGRVPSSNQPTCHTAAFSRDVNLAGKVLEYNPAVSTP